MSSDEIERALGNWQCLIGGNRGGRKSTESKACVKAWRGESMPQLAYNFCY